MSAKKKGNAGDVVVTDHVEITMISPRLLSGHPLNREFATSGVEWEEFVESVRGAGRIMTPLIVRWLPESNGCYQVIGGHRRVEAACRVGLESVPCVVMEMTDAEALVMLINENLQRLELSPVDEARLAAAMRDELELSPVEISQRISRSVEWVRTRQLMLDLGDELLEAVRDRHPDRHCCIATVEEILKVPEDLRGEAVQLVLHPDFESRPLPPDLARDVLRKVLVEPRLAAAAWEKGAKELAREWRKRLEAGRCALTGQGDIGVNVCSWKEWNNGEGFRAETWREAEDVIQPVLLVDDAPDGARWLDLAVRHGLAVRIIPGITEDETRAVVDGHLLQLAEDARRETGYDCWLRPGGTKVKDKRVEAAVANLDGLGDPEYDTEEAPEKLIAQGMEWHAWIDMGAVKRLAMWACGLVVKDGTQVPEWVPKWARDMICRGDEMVIDDVCAWVLGLKVGAGKVDDSDKSEKSEELRVRWSAEMLLETTERLLNTAVDEWEEFMNGVLDNGDARPWIEYLLAYGDLPKKLMHEVKRVAVMYYEDDFEERLLSENAVQLANEHLHNHKTTTDQAVAMRELLKKCTPEEVLELDLLREAGRMKLSLTPASILFQEAEKVLDAMDKARSDESQGQAGAAAGTPPGDKGPAEAANSHRGGAVDAPGGVFPWEGGEA